MKQGYSGEVVTSWTVMMVSSRLSCVSGSEIGSDMEITWAGVLLENCRILWVVLSDAGPGPDSDVATSDCVARDILVDVSSDCSMDTSAEYLRNLSGFEENS
jgi:hypothetical protein